MKNLITKKLALLAIVFFASIGHAFGAISVSITDDKGVAVDDVVKVWFSSLNCYMETQKNEMLEFLQGEENGWINVRLLSSEYQITNIKIDGNDIMSSCSFDNDSGIYYYEFIPFPDNFNVSIEVIKLEAYTISVNLNEGYASVVFFDGFVRQNGESVTLGKGRNVKMYINPSAGFEFSQVTIVDGYGNSIDATQAFDEPGGYYEFESPDVNYNVTVDFTTSDTKTITVNYNEEAAWVSLLEYKNDPNSGLRYGASSGDALEFNQGYKFQLTIGNNSGTYEVTSIIDNDEEKISEYRENNYYDFTLSDDHTISVTFAAMPTVTVNFDDNKGWVELSEFGSVAPDNPFGYSKGSTVRITPHASNGYKVGSVTVDGNAVSLTDGYYEFILTDDCVVNVVFEEVAKYTISYTFNREDVASVYVSWGGNLRPVNCSSSMEITEGSDVSMWTDWIDNSYYIKSFTVNDNDVTELFKSGNYSLSNVTSDLSIYVELETIEPSYAMNVTFNHDGFGDVCFDDSHYNRCVNYAQTVDVAAGEDIWVNVNLFSLVHPLKSIKVDDTDVTNDVKQNGGYSIPNISSNHSVYVEFDELPYNTISVNWQEGNADVYFEEGNFTLWGQEAQIVSGHNAKMYITPTAGYAISNVSISDGSSTQDITDSFNPNGGYYEFTSVNVDYTVTVQFTEVETRTITLSFDNEKGSVYINGRWVGPYEYAYNEGSTIRLTVNARKGYKVGSILVDDSEVTEAYKANGCYEFVLNSNSVVTVNFVEATYYTISLTGDDTEKGYYYLSHEGSIVEETDVYLYVYPETGYVPTATVDENEVDLSYNQEYGYYYYLISNLDANHTVNVTFGEKHISYVHLSINKNETKEVYLSNNSRTDSGDFRLTTGTTVRLVAYPQIGYELDSIYIDDTDITESYMENGYYDLVVTECTITVTMKKKTAPSTVTVTIPSSGVGTFCCEYDLNFSGVSGIKAYVASGYDPSTGDLVLTRVNDVPVGTGLLIKGTPGDYNVSSGNSNYIFANMLRGVVEQTTIRTEQWLYDGWNGERYYTSYILDTDGEFNIADNAYQVPANSAYLVIPSEYVNTSMAKLHNIFLDDEEEINGITTGVGFIWAGEKRNATATDDVYNLQGQKVNSKTLKPGIYIKNGKKFMVK